MSRSAPNLQALKDLEIEVDHQAGNDFSSRLGGDGENVYRRNSNQGNGNSSRRNIVDVHSNNNTHYNSSSRTIGRRRGDAMNKTLNSTFNHQKYSRPGRPKYASFVELCYGVALYLFCVFLPSLPRFIHQIYLWTNSILRKIIWWSLFSWHSMLVLLWKWGLITDPVVLYEEFGEEVEEGFVDDSSSSSSNLHAGKNRHGKFNGKRLKKAWNFLFSTTFHSVWEEFNNNKKDSLSSSSFASSSMVESAYTWGFGRSSTLNPAIAMVLHDVKFITMLAVTLAIIRVWLVHMLVPEYLAPTKLEALTRCKSSHLLSSSSYRFGGVRGWEKAAQRVGSFDGSNRREAYNGTRTRYERVLIWSTDHWYKLRPSIRRALGHEPTARYNDVPINPSSPNTAFRRANSREFTTSTNPTNTQQLFSAPRHATATFRFLYTSISCLSALLLFHNAEFWPHHVFGTHPLASTRHCWDLRGTVVALGFLDGDYDERNGALRYFFLAQAAYQLHSLCFHLVSMMLLLLYGGGMVSVRESEARGQNGDNNSGSTRLRWFSRDSGGQQHQQRKQLRLLSMKTSMQSYVRPMVEHFIVLALLVGSYSFSGLRRVGAVAIFTLEISSVFLQLLQVCIYAPETSWLRKPNVVIFVHRFLTIPTFVYCRFYVLPFVVWYSAAFESQEWLEQIEKVFTPGWGERIYTIFNGLLFLIFALNLILFRRLLFHPHLKQIVKQKFS
mmetsp:Transcript_7963/g.16267  ORF Transcript_7963/g.16267 Transcript_7963/m.16267 type:complete len:723 (+) Transcript_7963:274-2442(+)